MKLNNNNNAIWFIAIFLSITLILSGVSYAKQEKYTYGVNVVTVERKDKYEYQESHDTPLGRIPTTRTVSSPKPDYNFLLVTVKFIVNEVKVTGSKEELQKERLHLSVIDSERKIYPITFLGIDKIIVDYLAGEYTSSGIEAAFSVPKSSKGFRLRYRDLPLIDLPVEHSGNNL